MSKKKKTTLLILSILLFALITFIVVRNYVNKKEKPVLVTVKNGLSTNFLDGNLIEAASKDKEYSFSISNNSDVEKYYQIRIDNYKTVSNVKYKLVSDDSLVNVEKKIDGEILLDYAVINPGETHNYKLTILKSLNATTIGNISVDNYIFEQEYFAQTIIKNSEVSQKPKTVVGMEIAAEDEGLVQDVDDSGVTYYFRGISKDNYVRFANLMWRIVRINGDNTIKLILDGTTGVQVEYYLENGNNYFSYANSNVKTYLANWYQENLLPYEKFISTQKACDNYQFTGTEEFVFQSSQRLLVNHNPTFNCLGTKIGSKIYLITADEVEHAGGLPGVVNTNYYLYNGSINDSSWTMTPSKGNNNEFYPFTISTNGSLEDSNAGNIKRSVRPVINIVKDVSVTGKGTISEPYEILV